MAEYRIKGETLTGIADAIRSKTGSTESIPVPDMAAQINNVSSLPPVTAEDNGKIMQVVDGTPSAVTVEESAVATYVDDYINEALGGDY